MKIYTKTGDQGMTSLFGGERVWKDDLRIEAYGNVDEVNSLIGMAISEIKDEDLLSALKKIQNNLFSVGSDLASPREKDNKTNSVPRIDQKYIDESEELIDKFNDRLPELKHFILPGGTKGAAILHTARTVCRRSERAVIKLSKVVDIGSEVSIYLNRLSDLFFVLARYENYVNNTPDVEWNARK